MVSTIINPATSQALHYPLPKDLIASKPVEPRDHSHLLHLTKANGKIHHLHFFDLPNLLRPGDVLVRNESKVIPARLFGTKPTGGKVQLLLNRILDPATNTWECLLKPGVAPQTVLNFSPTLSGKITKDVQDDLVFQIRFNSSIEQLYYYLDSTGLTPLPPYVKNNQTRAESYWREVYQTTYAKNKGSVAAPTAGLHFTPSLDALLLAKGVEICTVTLHVGLGTFAPIKTSDYAHHHLHKEDFELRAETAERINQAKKEGRRIIAVGTTTVRVLEHCSVPVMETDSNEPSYQLQPQTGTTSIFIYPPYHFKCVDALITNFHLPGTSLLLLVSALTSSPNTNQHFSTFQESMVGKAYAEAIAQQYRFFSFGDAMFIE